MKFFEDAMRYHARGWSIIPIRHKSESGKEPTVAWTPYKQKRPDPAQLKRWFSDPTLDGLAVILGTVSGNLCCRDFDTLESYERWAAKYPNLAAKLPTVETARGRHVYFTGPATGIKKGADGELRCGNGYCLLPPSKHPRGMEYCWLVPLPEGPLPEIPDPAAAGLLPVTERTESGGLLGTALAQNTERTEKNRENPENRETQNIEEDSSNDGEPDCFHLSPFSLYQESLENAIAQTLPASKGQRNRRLFVFARALKAMPQYADAEKNDLRDVVRAWHQRALPFIGTEAFDDTWFDFTYAWDKVKYPLGTGPMQELFAKAVASEPPAAALQYEQPELRRLVALCRELQRAAGVEAFYLACRTAADLLKVPLMKINRWLNGLVNDGLLAIVQKGGQADTVRKATRYRYLGDL